MKLCVTIVDINPDFRNFMEARMEEKKTVVAGVRLTPTQAKKLKQLADAFGVKRNDMLCRLIDNARIVDEPRLEVSPADNKVTA